MPSEVFSWPEGLAYIYTGSASALVSFCENVNLTQTFEWAEVRYFGGTMTDIPPVFKPVKVTIGHMMSTLATYALATALTAVNVEFQWSSVAGNSGGFLMTGARILEWSLGHTDGDVVHTRLSIKAPGVSAYGTGLS